MLILFTYDHPFFVKGKGFVYASDLYIGAELIDKDGNTVTVSHIYREKLEGGSTNVYNFKVDDFHTYYVGECGIWVHNSECTIEFSNNSGRDADEFRQQLKDQQDGLGELTIDEYQNNRAEYNRRKAETGNGRDPDSASYQQAAREEAISARIEDNMINGNMSYDDALAEANSWAKGKAALHGPDQVAGGYAQNISGLGDSGINSSIGSQWKADSRIVKLDDYIQEQALTHPGSTKLSELRQHRTKIVRQKRSQIFRQSA